MWSQPFTFGDNDFHFSHPRGPFVPYDLRTSNSDDGGPLGDFTVTSHFCPVCSYLSYSYFDRCLSSVVTLLTVTVLVRRETDKGVTVRICVDEGQGASSRPRGEEIDVYRHVDPGLLRGKVKKGKGINKECLSIFHTTNLLR